MEEADRVEAQCGAAERCDQRRQDLADAKSLARCEPFRQRQVKAELVHHVGVAPAGKQHLLRRAEAGAPASGKLIGRRWGAQVLSCLDASSTKVKLNQQLHFAADNAIPVSTPQMYLGDLKVCDEDTDLGLKYTLTQLAPEVVR